MRIWHSLDYGTGVVVKTILDGKIAAEPEARLAELRKLRAVVGDQIGESIHWTGPKLRELALARLVGLKGEGGTLETEALQALGAYRAPVTHRKIEKALEAEIFRCRQMDLFERKGG